MYSHTTIKAAIRITLSTIDTLELPVRYTREKQLQKRPSRKQVLKQRGSETEKAFRKRIGETAEAYERLANAIDEHYAIPLSFGFNPYKTYKGAFEVFTDYFAERRSGDADSTEISALSYLHTICTDALFNRFDENPKVKTQLKSDSAQKLMEAGTVNIEGIEVNLWQGHSFGNIEVREGWDKMKSIRETNQDTTGELGKLMITGSMQIPRQQALDIAAKSGFRVTTSVGRTLDYLVLGTENVSPNKLAKALELNKEGAEIKFLSEEAFLSLLSEAGTE